MENDLCGRCNKKTCLLISDSSFYEKEICKTCYLKIRARSKIFTEGGGLPRTGNGRKIKRGFSFDQEILATLHPGHLRRV